MYNYGRLLGGCSQPDALPTLPPVILTAAAPVLPTALLRSPLDDRDVLLISTDLLRHSNIEKAFS